MRLVSTVEQLSTNIETLRDYLDSPRSEESQEARRLMSRGICFVAVESDGEWFFAPSRFIGYVGNNLSAHADNEGKHGGETNVAIASVLGREPRADNDLEAAYQAFCEEIGVQPARGDRRKFWHLLPGDPLADLGGRTEAAHEELELWDAFLDRWPISRLATMRLDEYSAAGSKDTFTYWIEAALAPLGSIWGGSAFKFGIFSRSENTEAKPGKVRAYDDRYAWYAKYGETAEEAFETVRAHVHAVAKSARAGDLEYIESIPLGDAFKWKIAFHYQDRAHPCLPSVFTSAPLRAFLGGERATNVPLSALYREVMKRKGEDEHILVFGKRIWQAYVKAHPLDIKLTEGAIRKGRLSFSLAQAPFPESMHGGKDEGDAGDAALFETDQGDSFESDIRATNKSGRLRTPLHNYFSKVAAQVGDTIRITPLPDGRYRIEHRSDTSHDPFEAAFQRTKGWFKRAFPDFQSFHDHPGYAQAERNYKNELLAAFRTDVAPALADGRMREAGEAAIRLLTRTLPGNDGKPQNIIGWRYIDHVRHLDDAGNERFGTLLRDLVDPAQDLGARIDRFCQGLRDLSEGKVIPAVLRSFVGFYLTLADPDSFLFLKTKELGEAIREFEPDFAWSRSGPTAEEAESIATLAKRIKERLNMEGWEPRDLIDVQGFLWTGHYAQGLPKGEDNEEVDDDDTESMVREPASMKKPPLNQILYGPPGTGKTYSAVTKALEILDPDILDSKPDNREAHKTRFDELARERRVRTITFHQSFSYEDFIEGLRADSEEDGSLRYRVEPGVFRQLCRDALEAPSRNTGWGVSENPRIWKLSIFSTRPNKVRDYCLQNGEARIGWGKSGDLSDVDFASVQNNTYLAELGSNSLDTLASFSQEIAPGDVIVCIGSVTEAAAIGVVEQGYSFDPSPKEPLPKHFGHLLKVNWILKDLALPLTELNGGKRFTQKTVYELDRFGWPELLALLHEKNLLPRDTAQSAPARPYVLIIDEINRGNISRIFGEIITLIEPSKRDGAPEALRALLPYSKQSFSIPGNVYLIGTMNTADRSLAGLDIALRRRFDFVEMPPDPRTLEGVSVQGVDIAAMLATMNQRIEVLLDRDHALGHSYFLPLRQDNSIERLAAIFRSNILPLLQEYFFEDWQRIAWVLNDHRKDKSLQIVQATEYDVGQLLGGDSGVPTEAKVWNINTSALGMIESYAGILEKG